MNDHTESEVIVYHDDTRKAGNDKLNGHILLFVPHSVSITQTGTLFGPIKETTQSWQTLAREILRLREQFQANHKFHFKSISGKKWNKYNQAEKRFVELGVDALRSKKTKYFPNPLHCKMAVIFFPNPVPSNLEFYGGEDKREKQLRFMETLLRMLLKGAIHYLYSTNHKVRISKIITDGQPYHRRLSEERVLWRLIKQQLIDEVRLYATIRLDSEIIHLPSDHKMFSPESEDYFHANMLQLADMLLGSTVQSCLKGIVWESVNPRTGQKVNDKKSIIAFPVKEMLDKRKRGKNFRHSGHYRSFTISKAYIKDQQWQFENILTQDLKIDACTGQINLFEFCVKGEQ